MERTIRRSTLVTVICALVAVGSMLIATHHTQTKRAFAQASSPNPATIPAGMGSPTSNGVLCGPGMASTSTASLYIDRSVPSNQNAINRCTLGSDGVTYTWQLPYNTPVVSGTTVKLTNQTANTGTLTLCPADATCPAGFYHLDIRFAVSSGATLATLSAVNLSYTDDVGAVTNYNIAAAVGNTCPTLSLASVTRCSIAYNFRKTANTAVTIAVVLGGTGSPTYNFDAATIQAF